MVRLPATCGELARFVGQPEHAHRRRLLDDLSENRPHPGRIVATCQREPSLIAVRIDDKPGVGATRRDPVQIRERFMHGLGVREPL